MWCRRETRSRRGGHRPTVSVHYASRDDSRIAARRARRHQQQAGTEVAKENASRRQARRKDSNIVCKQSRSGQPVSPLEGLHWPNVLASSYACSLLLDRLCLAAANAATAQPGPPAPPLETSWRAAVDGGVSADAMTTVGSVSLEQAWRGPVSRGARVWATLDPDGGFVDDGASMTGGGGEAYGVASTRDRWVDLRAGAGVGLAILDYGSGGFGGSGSSFTGVRPYLVGVLGLDLYPHRAVGLGPGGPPGAHAGTGERVDRWSWACASGSAARLPRAGAARQLAALRTSISASPARRAGTAALVSSLTETDAFRPRRGTPARGPEPPPQLLHHRPHRPRQVDVGRPAAWRRRAR